MAGATLGVPAAAQAQTESTPSLRLFAATRGVTAEGPETGLAPDLGLWVAAVGGEVRLEVRRPRYRRWRVRQIDPGTGRTVRAIPARMLNGWQGLRRFLVLRFADGGGRTVARRFSDFCPAGIMGERVDDHGPRNSAYGFGCYVDSPFAQGTIWGIDAGWAAPATTYEELDLPPGRYIATASITHPYRRVFDIPAARATARVRVRIPPRARRDRRRARDAATSLHVPRAPRAAAQVEAEAAALPDLVALPAWEIVTRAQRRRDLLRFSSTAWNAGPAPLVVEGFRRSGRDVMDAYQYFEDAAGDVVGRAPAGTMAFERHGGHDHWHFLQFASYHLVDARHRTVARAGKQSFCLVPTDAIDLTLPRAPWSPFEMADQSSCGSPTSIWIRETLPVGWGDTYGRDLGGQAFDITTLRNGRYDVEIRLNPANELREADTSNNVQPRRIRLGGRRGARTVRVTPWHGIRR